VSTRSPRSAAAACCDPMPRPSDDVEARRHPCSASSDADMAVMLDELRAEARQGGGRSSGGQSRACQRRRLAGFLGVLRAHRPRAINGGTQDGYAVPGRSHAPGPEPRRSRLTCRVLLAGNRVASLRGPILRRNRTGKVVTETPASVPVSPDAAASAEHSIAAGAVYLATSPDLSASTERRFGSRPPAFSLSTLRSIA